MSPLRRALAVLALVVAALPLAARDTPNAPLLSGQELLKTDILGVFAHPDDETGAAGTLAAYALGKGSVIAHVYCTRGEGGGNMVGTQGGPALGILREIELRQCLATLGVQRCFFLDQTDFAYTESLSVTLEKWGHEETLRRLVRHVRALRPEVILTMNPAPTPGQHGNHQAAGVLAIEAFDAAGDPARFPEQLRGEGLSVWQPRKLYYGGPAGTGATVDLSRPVREGRTAGDVAGEALAAHRSQGFGAFAGSPWLRRPQHWTLVKSIVPFASDESDLFRGLPVANGVPSRVIETGETSKAVGSEFRFIPRPAVEWFQRWVAEQRIESVAAQFVADVPVVAGESNGLPLEVLAPGGVTTPFRIAFQAPEGWVVSPAVLEVPVSSQSSQRLQVRVTPPTGLPPDGELIATAMVDGKEIRTSARMHPVPHLKVPRVTRGLPMTDSESDPGWGALPVHSIDTTRTWQGTVTNAADCSGAFRLTHDGTLLYVEVRVHDDQVVSNIATNDIRGHWRSDSVELCFDPKGGAEHTLGTFKIGIFPFDAAGRVRAARDADARPGLLEETAPGTRLVSWRTLEGYAIRAAIPLAEIGMAPGASAQRLGVNVLIYDGDKADASPGENINRSRLAWSPRPGVQGRPEDWGRADLE